ncbi:hypothetical protein MM213_12285 [Belliella sp. R4-6]|uniref:DUF3298 domain-containing protein n=1 Tax=Belliella alkalica TaxID=1730871 RepID=A0ABS9VCW1_9BACT|nr:hypothetical protein [Belliella alkalica]MCH7414269.1 hypothetical protein [Belliella alkalica]
MKKALFLSTCILFCFSVYSSTFAQVDTTKVSFIAYWSVGDVYKYEVSKYKKQWSGDDLIKNDSSKYLAKFEVIDSTETSYKVKWEYENEIFRSAEIPDEVLNKIGYSSITEVIFLTDEYGTYQGIENWEEIRDMIIGVFDVLIPILSEGKDTESIYSALSPMIEMYKTKAGIEDYLLPELNYFHFPLGSEFAIGEVFEYEEFLANMFGNEKIKAKAKVYLDEVDFEDDYCILIQEMELDEKGSKKMVSDYFKLLKLESEELDIAMEEAIMEINDFNVFGYYFYPGVPDYIHVKREVYFELGEEVSSRRDQTIIKLYFDEN